MRAAHEMESQLEGVYSGPLHHESPVDLVNKLAAAIQAGDQQMAGVLGSRLSSLKLKLNINLQTEDYEQRCQEDEFSVKVHVEDRESDGCIIHLIVKACDTIGDLKKKIMLKYDFPIAVQRWIISRKIPMDHEKLSQCGVKGPGHTLYLYVVTARSVGLSRQQHEINRHAAVHGVPLAPYPPQLGPEFQRDLAMEQIEPWRPSMGGQPAIPVTAGQLLTTTSAPLIPLNDNVPPIDPSAAFGSNAAASSSPPPTETNRQMSKTSVSSGSCRLQNMLDSPNLSMNSSHDLSSETLYQPIATVVVNDCTSSSGATLASGQNKAVQEGWTCKQCTYFNVPLRPGCEMCSGPRPQDYQVPPGYQPSPAEVAMLEDQRRAEQNTREAAEQEALENYQELLAMDDLDLIPNAEAFSCPICFDDFEPREGIILRECLHTFCRVCLSGAIQHSDEAYLKCPYQDDDFSCDAMLQEREIRALVPDELYLKYLQRGLDQAESQAANSYHCKTTDCQGWCLYEDQVNFFRCPVCRKENCLTCKAIHEGMNCKQYQEDLEIRANNDIAARQTKEMLQRLVESKEAMHCPQCKVIVQKKGGCDWIRCSICKLEICWVTQKPRWGPRGEGDTSGGCGCRINGRKCHPNCINCH